MKILFIDGCGLCQTQPILDPHIRCGGCGKPTPYHGGPWSREEELCSDCMKEVQEMRKSGEL